MTDPRRERGGGTVKPSDGPQKRASEPQRSSKTEGTNRDYDETGEAANQRHGHPRDERGGPGDSAEQGGSGEGGGQRSSPPAG